MKKLTFAFLGLVLGIAMAAAISSYAASRNCFPVGAGACVQVAIPIGTYPPVKCVEGEIFIDTSTGVATNCATTSAPTICVCTAADTWAEIDAK